MFTSTDRIDSTQTVDSFRPRGFFTGNGYVGFLPDGRRLSFPTYSEYLELIEEEAA